MKDFVRNSAFLNRIVLTRHPDHSPIPNSVKKFKSYLLKATYYCIIEFVYLYHVISVPVSCWL